MNTPLLQMTPQMADSCFAGKSATSISSKRSSHSDEERTSFSTIDGSVITYNAGTNAVSNGAGIFIGDYFVGVAEHFLTICNTPFIKY